MRFVQRLVSIAPFDGIPPPPLNVFVQNVRELTRFALQKDMEQVLVDHELSPNDHFPLEFLQPLKNLWEDEGVKKAIAKGNEYALHDNLD